MVKTEDESKQASEMIQHLEALLRLGQLAEADSLLAQVKVEDLHNATLLGMVTLTWHAKNSLFLRDAFLSRAEPVLVERLGKDRAQRLLQNRR